MYCIMHLQSYMSIYSKFRKHAKELKNYAVFHPGNRLVVSRIIIAVCSIDIVSNTN